MRWPLRRGSGAYIAIRGKRLRGHYGLQRSYWKEASLRRRHVASRARNARSAKSGVRVLAPELDLTPREREKFRDLSFSSLMSCILARRISAVCGAARRSTTRKRLTPCTIDATLASLGFCNRNNLGSDGGPGESRTPDQRFRKPLLYPSELQARLACGIKLFRSLTDCGERVYVEWIGQLSDTPGTTIIPKAPHCKIEISNKGIRGK